MSRPRFFRSEAEWRRWLEKNHATASEQTVGFHKKATGRSTFTHRKALDEALCFGWIDGVAHSIDAERWQIRFSPRRVKSVWSDVNIKRFKELQGDGRVAPAGLAAFEARDPKYQKRYASENRDAGLTPAEEKAFRAEGEAWRNFEAMPPSYQRPAIWWVVSAKKEETRARRLATLISDSGRGVRIKPLRRPGDPG